MKGQSIEYQVYSKCLISVEDDDGEEEEEDEKRKEEQEDGKQKEREEGYIDFFLK